MTEMEKNLKRIGDYIFYAALVLEMLYVIIDKSEYILPYETWLFRLTFLMFAVKIACTKYTCREWVCIVLMGLLGVISFVATDREEIIKIVAFVVACKGIDIKTAAKVTFYETLVGCLIITLLSVTGIYGAVSVTGHFRGGGIEETRYCFGMGHPNAFHCMFFVILVLGMAIYNEKLKWYTYLLLQFLNMLVYFYTDSRTGMLMVTAAILFGAFLRYGKKLREKKLLYILSIVFIVCCVLFTVFVGIYGVDFPIMRQIDIRINGRFQYGKSDGGIQYWSLFSSPDNQNYFDMGYMRLFYWYGIIPGILYTVIMCIMIWNCYKQKAYDAFLVIMAFSAYMLIEAHTVSVYIGRNYILLFIGAMWYTILSRKQENAQYIFHVFRLFKKKEEGTSHAEH
ncbi:MAG: hypothetical protein IJN54_07820 [Lachnospiraceae bacterium]|nr:hypothetical protein [Lachnospiraceae bacterium]